jgi:hypothetical protein
MSFRFGQRVRLTRDLQMSGFKVAEGIEGTVTKVHLQTSVLFDGLEQELAVADSDIETVSGMPKSKKSKSTTGVSVATAPEGFLPGQHVRLLVTKHIGGQSIPAGSLGIVTQAAPSMNASWVVFDGFGGDKLIPNGDLAAA